MSRIFRQGIYLDSAATTPVARDVLRNMMPYFSERFFIQHPEFRIDRARQNILSTLFNTWKGELIFTSSGSEANTLALVGLADYLKLIGKTHIITTSIEHASVLNATKYLLSQGFEVTYIDPDKNGVVSAFAVRSAIRPNTGLISVMYVNNETGAVQPVQAIGRACSSRHVIFHCDCVQAAETMSINPDDLHADLITVSGHKLNAPKGVGCLYVASRILPELKPVIFGGRNQEYGLRGGTENIPAIIGFEQACVRRKNCIDIDEVNKKYAELKNTFLETIQSFGELEITENTNHGIDRILSIRIKNINADTLRLACRSQNIYFSTGAACSSSAMEPSHVLKAMGLSDEEARSTIRVSFSCDLSVKDVKKAAKSIGKTAVSLIGVSEDTEHTPDLPW